MNRGGSGDIGNRNSLNLNKKELAMPCDAGRNGKRNLGYGFCRVKLQCKRYGRFAAADRNSFFGENGGGIVWVVAEISELHNQNGIRRQGGNAPEGCRAIY